MNTKKEYMPVWAAQKIMTGELPLTSKSIEKYSSELTFQELVDKKNEHVKESRLRAKHIVPITVRDEEHHKAVVENIMINVSLSTRDFGFTEMVGTELIKTKQPVSFEMFIFKDMPESFDPVVYGNELTSLLSGV